MEKKNLMKAKTRATLDDYEDVVERKETDLESFIGNLDDKLSTLKVQRKRLDDICDRIDRDNYYKNQDQEEDDMKKGSSLSGIKLGLIAEELKSIRLAIDYISSFV